jgi:hypothetical protein
MPATDVTRPHGQPQPSAEHEHRSADGCGQDCIVPARMERLVY